MFSWSRVGFLGACVALAAGLAFLIRDCASSSGEKERETRPRPDGESPREEGEGEEEEGEGEEEEGDEEARTPAVFVEAENEPQSRPMVAGRVRVLVLGLDGAGKTSLLHCWATGCLMQDAEPTLGFNAVSINREDLRIQLLEIGGKKELRPYWQRFMSGAQLLVFVVDSSNPKLFPVAKKHLHELLASDPCLPLMVLANKQDLPEACSIIELYDALSLDEVGDHRLLLFSTHV